MFFFRFLKRAIKNYCAVYDYMHDCVIIIMLQWLRSLFIASQNTRTNLRALYAFNKNVSN